MENVVLLSLKEFADLNQYKEKWKESVDFNEQQFNERLKTITVKYETRSKTA